MKPGKGAGIVLAAQAVVGPAKNSSMRRRANKTNPADVIQFPVSCFLNSPAGCLGVRKVVVWKSWLLNMAHGS
jgi:hypothetical protein